MALGRFLKMTHTAYNIVIHRIKNINCENGSICSQTHYFFSKQLLLSAKQEQQRIDLFIISKKKMIVSSDRELP